MRVAPADVTGGGVAAIRRGLAWWRHGVLYTAAGRPDSPTVAAYPTDGPPVRVGSAWQITMPDTASLVTVTSCGCSSPWKRIDTGPLEQLVAV